MRCMYPNSNTLIYMYSTDGQKAQKEAEGSQIEAMDVDEAHLRKYEVDLPGKC